jgi:hypothetical protein
MPDHSLSTNGQGLDTTLAKFRQPAKAGYGLESPDGSDRRADQIAEPALALRKAWFYEKFPDDAYEPIRRF